MPWVVKKRLKACRNFYTNPFRQIQVRIGPSQAAQPCEGINMLRKHTCDLFAHMAHTQTEKQSAQRPLPRLFDSIE